MAEDFTEMEGACSVLAQARHESGATQTQIAEACGVSVTAVSQWLHGRTTPTADNWICALRGCGFEVVVQPITDDEEVEHMPASCAGASGSDRPAES